MEKNIMKNLIKTFSIIALSCSLAACSQPTPKVVEEPAVTPPIVGADKDEHGCIASAGYIWSALRNECIRLFESGIRLDPQEAIADKTVSAFIVFKNETEDKTAEVYLPGEGGPRIYVKQANNMEGDEGTWKEGNMTLRFQKGMYILDDPTGKTLYKGK